MCRKDLHKVSTGTEKTSNDSLYPAWILSHAIIKLRHTTSLHCNPFYKPQICHCMMSNTHTDLPSRAKALLHYVDSPGICLAVH